jgi:hypothetical protein
VLAGGEAGERGVLLVLREVLLRLLVLRVVLGC